MKKYQWPIALACALIISATSAIAAESTSAKAASSMRKVSEAGGKAFQDIEMARLAIFNGHPETATTLVKKAQASLKQAQNDGTSFQKDEAALTAKPPYNNPANPNGEQRGITWLPVGGDISLAEDYSSDPAKAAAVAKANEHLKKGERDAAMHTLRLADINLAFTVIVVPEKSAMAHVDEAGQLLAAGKYYEANLALKDVESSVHYDTLDVNDVMAPAEKPAKVSASAQEGVEK